MIVIAGTMRLPRGNLGRARERLEPLISATRAEEGCLGYAFAEDLLDPGLIHVAERWRDHAALDGHFKAPHLAEGREAFKELGSSEWNLRMFETDDGIPL
jgi:quinol monooxygenase YgiN